MAAAYKTYAKSEMLKQEIKCLRSTISVTVRFHGNLNKIYVEPLARAGIHRKR